MADKKAELLEQANEYYEERAAIYEYEANFSRPDAEKMAQEATIKKFYPQKAEKP